LETIRESAEDDAVIHVNVVVRCRRRGFPLVDVVLCQES
jgi:hypothetical protein